MTESWLSRNLKALKLLSFPTPHRTPGISDLEHYSIYILNSNSFTLFI